ncbi:hypothetical protein BpHYR1_022781 [Brachionus plicatilis]|uniref:Uncharacterized protein n=1 Tax=Brachionus plicatilis TaxID=10195 RepID=A0A3M7QLS0_BRAPC|nr:hypothetical protein BpHYR1_022781 [Brachionus plicatilis]
MFTIKDSIIWVLRLARLISEIFVRTLLLSLVHCLRHDFVQEKERTISLIFNSWNWAREREREKNSFQVK